MMREIGDELQLSTHAISQALDPGENVKILDLCMAPGGYTASALKYNPGGTAFGITLPPEQGGNEVLLKSSQSTVQYLDITMLAKEFGVDDIPITHPEHASFLDQRPYYGQTFDLVFCDGQVLRTHQRAEYREYFEGLRLTVSQLILALQRIRPGGTLIMLLHKIEAWDTMELLYRFSKFASIQVFKPMKKHAIRSSFYFIAREVQPDGEAAKEAVGMWKQAWWNSTFGGENGIGGRSVAVDEEFVRTVISQFGERFIELGWPIWETQAIALDKMDFVHGKS
jgi:23S rRNA U2552 (ribose-2'-O)-methylase RlmE/FtsJ